MADAIPRFNARNLPDSRFRRHHQSIIERERDREFDVLLEADRRGQVRAATDDRRTISGLGRQKLTIETCPLPPSWRSWDLFGADYRHLSADEHCTCAAARRLLPLEFRGLLTVDWEVASDDETLSPTPMMPEESGQPDSRFSKGSPSHVHADVVIDSHAVHIDHVYATKSGPGRSHREIRIFVAGRLGGRGGRCGCALGFGANDLPAVAALGQDGAIVVDDCSNGLIVELWKAHLIGCI